MKVDNQPSFLYYIYPFRVNFKSICNICEFVDKVKINNCYVWEKRSYLNDDILPNISNFLNNEKVEKSCAQFWQLSPSIIQSHNHGLGAGKNSNVTWSLCTRSLIIEFLILHVELVIFRSGICFLIFHIVLNNNNLSAWLDFNHHFRFINGQRDINVCLIRRTRLSDQSNEPLLLPFFPRFCGGIEDHPLGKGNFFEIVTGIIDNWVLKSNVISFDEVFIHGQLIPYSCIFIEAAEKESIENVKYQIGNFFHSHQRVLLSKEEVNIQKQIDFQYAENQWFLFSLDGGGFVAFDAPKTDFFCITLPSHLRQHYFLSFLIALFQRFTLIDLSNQVSESWEMGTNFTEENTPKMKEVFSDIHNQLLSFTARGYFSQVMQQEHHHRYFDKWLKVFQIDRLYSEVKEEVYLMNNFIQTIEYQHAREIEEAQRKQTENLESKLNLVAWLIGIPALSMSYLQVTGIVSHFVALSTLFGSATLGLLLYSIFSRFSKK